MDTIDLAGLDPHTPITTAARRITRAVNRTPASLETWFDIEGRELSSHSAEMWGPAPAGAAVCLRGAVRSLALRMTEREAQDHLDAHAAGMEAAQFLAALDIVRGVER